MRSLFFLIFFYSGVIILLILFLPTLLMPKNIVFYGGRLLGYWTKFCLKLIMAINIEIKGKENLNYYDKFFVACSHQSIFETFFLQTLFNKVVFVLKKELTKIPLFGWYLLKMGCVSIDRNKVTKENINFSEKIYNTLKYTNQTLIIFPQGTRKTFDDRSKFKKGIGRIYKDTKLACLPIAINSGKAWPRNGRLVPGQTITVSILKLYTGGLNTNNFVNDIEKLIYNELNIIS